MSIAGNSVDTGTGGFTMEAAAIEVQGGRSLGFVVAHDSITTPATIIGQPLLVGVGWTHNYAARIQGRSGGPITVHWDDHRSNRFGYSNGSYIPLDQSSRRAERLEEVNGDARCNECVWRVTKEDGSILLFDAQGVLKKIEQDLPVHRRDEGELFALRSSMNRSLAGAPHLQLRRYWQTDSLHPGRGLNAGPHGVRRPEPSVRCTTRSGESAQHRGSRDAHPGRGACSERRHHQQSPGARRRRRFVPDLTHNRPAIRK
ncbi:MAG: DUF6531 domain-containing protein [Bryobacterales bacterium]